MVKSDLIAGVGIGQTVGQAVAFHREGEKEKEHILNIIRIRSRIVSWMTLEVTDRRRVQREAERLSERTS